MKRVIVIGGGAAGMMAAITASQNGRRVTLLEQNEKLGKKLYITGKGRCNMTNAGGRDAFFANVVRNARFLYSAWNACSDEYIVRFMNELGVPTKVERGARVFPETDKSSDVLRALSLRLERCGVEVRLNTCIKGILAKEHAIVGVQTEGGVLEAEAVVLATGGKSYPSTGSTGDGYAFLTSLGHSIMPPRPSLVPLETEEAWPYALAGLTLKNVTLHAYEGKKRVYAEMGELLFTHFGVSGPLALSASAYLNVPEGARLLIDLKPALDADVLDKRLLRDIEANKRASVKNAFAKLLPHSLLPDVLRIAGVDALKTAGEMTRLERQALIETLKALPLTVKKVRDWNEAIITCGGVSTKEINPATMESKLVRGLYLAGELIDVDALTGGFNLQIAWSTGMLAGLNC